MLCNCTQGDQNIKFAYWIFGGQIDELENSLKPSKVKLENLLRLLKQKIFKKISNFTIRWSNPKELSSSAFPNHITNRKILTEYLGYFVGEADIINKLEEFAICKFLRFGNFLLANFSLSWKDKTAQRQFKNMYVKL